MHPARFALLLALVAPATPRPPRVLFVGNSLTYVNDLPGLVARISASLGAPLETHSVVHADYGLEDHWRDGIAQQLLTDQRWDIVVLQQGPSSLPASGENLVEYVGRFAGVSRLHGVCPAVYMVWAESAWPASFDAVSAHHRAAADSAHAQLLPAGEAWRAAWRRDPGLSFYSADGLHPTPLGSYVAALTIAAGLTGRSPIGDTTTVTGAPLDAHRRRVIQEAVAATLRGVPAICVMQ